jgi:hypothetical protein
MYTASTRSGGRLDGFPNLRPDLSDDPEVCHRVCWGEPEPEPPAIDASDLEWAMFDLRQGRMYGYSHRAIHDYLSDRYPRDVVDLACPGAEINEPPD